MRSNVRRRVLGLVLSAGLPLSGIAPARSLASGVDDGIAWLESHQDASGLWGLSGKTPFRDSAVALQVLARLGGDAAVVGSAEAAVNGAATASTDYLARQVLALAHEAVSPSRVGDLAGRQNADGGFGFAAGYASDVLDASLALSALASAGFSDAGALGDGVSYLTSAQNPDGGWGLVEADSSRVFFTAHAVLALAALRSGFDVATEIQAGVDWLQTQAHGDGGYGTGGASNPWETGLAMKAIFQAEPGATELTGGRTYLDATQQGNGSWNDDAYQTARAIDGLSIVAPDLEARGTDIAFSDPTPDDGDVVTIAATVRNAGLVGADSVVVRLFDGDPDAGGTQIGGDQLVIALGPGATTVVEVAWDTFGQAGNHTIHLLLDAPNSIAEADETNNAAQNAIHVNFPADLAIAPSDIVFDPAEPDPGESVIIRTTVHNAGEATATSVALQIYHSPENPDGDVIPLMGTPFIISSIPPGGQFTLNLNMGTYFDAEGEYPILACADVDSTVREISEANNCAYRSLWVGPQPFLVALKTGLNLLALPSLPDDPVSAFTMIQGLPSTDELAGWDRPAQRWLTAIDAGGGTFIGDDFDIVLRDGFFARSTDTVTGVFLGRDVTAHGCTALEGGLNIISVPNSDACVSAFDLLGEIAGAEEAHKWDADLQSWETAVKIDEGVFAGSDFPVERGFGYFVNTTVSGDWCTSACDTVPSSLPDLRITTTDIFFDTNPVAAGDTVGIFVNIDNIGTETAFTPRLDIWAGDPDGGGTPLLSAPLPIDIPAGESSGYWGSYFVFTDPGFIDIWGVADIFDEIAELDETNNRAFRTLQVVAAAKALAGSPGGPSPRLHRLGPDPAPAALAAAPARGGPEGTSGEAVSAITNVTVANTSSASATIHWVTDVPAGGCVRYGVTEPLGSTAWERGPDRDVHGVVLEGLSPSTTYFFQIVSGGRVEDNGGRSHTFRTTTPGAGRPGVLHGRAVDAEAGAGDVLVLAWLQHDGDVSTPASVRTAADGRWVVNLGNLKDPRTGDPMPYRPADTVRLSVLGGRRGAASASITLDERTPQDGGEQRLVVDGEPASAPPPSRYFLAANTPNPFKAETTVRFGLPVSDRVELSVYNVLGQRVATLLRGPLDAGVHEIRWDGRTSSGEPAPSGVYFCRLDARDFSEARKMFLVR
jgi:hypothetical protein